MFDMQATMFQPVGGMDRIAAAFEKKLSHGIRFDAKCRADPKNTEGRAYRLSGPENGEKSVSMVFRIESGISADATIRLHRGGHPRFSVPIADTHAPSVFSDCSTLASKRMPWESFFFERRCDSVHSAHRLEHRCLHVKHVFKKHAVPKIGVQQRTHVQRITRHAALVARAR